MTVPQKTAGVRAALYLRVSTDRQTVEHQRAAARVLLHAALCVGCTFASGGFHKWQGAPLEVEEVESGAKARPQLRELCASLRAGDVLAVWALDRLGRNALEQVNLIRSLLDRGVRLLSVQEPWIDQPAAIRDLLIFIFAWVAEQERRRLVERTRAGVATARAKGKRLGRPAVGQGKGDTRQNAAVVFLHVVIGKAQRAQHLDAANLKPDQVVGVVDDAHLVGFGIAHPDGRDHWHLSRTFSGLKRNRRPGIAGPPEAYGLTWLNMASLATSLKLT